MRRGQLDHELDDVARGAELAVLPGAGDLAEHVFVEVALGVAVLHRHLVDHVHDLGEQRRRRDGEARILHVVRVGRAVAAERAQEREDVLADDGEHLRRREVLEARPAAGPRRARPAGDRPCPRERRAAPSACLSRVGLALLQRVQVVEPLDEEQVGDLLDDLERIGDAARPEGIPEGVDLTADFAGEHRARSIGTPLRAGEKKGLLAGRRSASARTLPDPHTG